MRRFRWADLVVAVCWTLCVVAGVLWAGGRLDLDVPGARWVWSQRWWVLAAGSMLAVIGLIVFERRRACPVCGARPFARVMDMNLFDEDNPRYSVRHCRSCGTRQVECERGVARLPERDWESAAERYARGEEEPTRR